MQIPPNGRVIGESVGRSAMAGRIVGSEGGRPSYGGTSFIPDHCYDLTKGGLPCKANNVKGTKFCVGHTRARAALNA